MEKNTFKKRCNQVGDAASCPHQTFHIGSGRVGRELHYGVGADADIHFKSYTRVRTGRCCTHCSVPMQLYGKERLNGTNRMGFLALRALIGSS